MHPAASRAARLLATRALRGTPPYRVYRRANLVLTRVPGAGVLRTGPKTAEWAVKALVRTRRHDGAPGTPPTARPTVALGAQVALDEALLGLMMRPSKFPSADDYERVGAEVAAAADRYRAEGWVADPASYHRTPPPLSLGRSRRRRWLRERFEQLSWDSEWEPRPGEPGRDRWLSYTANHTAHAQLLRHGDGTDRPWVVCLHGFGMGFVAADFTAFVARRAHLELGLNLAFPVMPLHGPRKHPGAPDLLSYDLMGTVHGITQAIWDIRRLVGLLRELGGQQVGIHGISLGGYTGALLAGLEDLDLAIAGIPAVDFPGLFRHHAPHRVERAARHNGLLGDDANDAHRVISPLAVAPRVPLDRRYVYAGLGDRMVPPPQPRALWEHWERPAMCWYPGNHTGFMWSSKVKSFVTDALVASGFCAEGAAPAGALPGAAPG